MIFNTPDSQHQPPTTAAGYGPFAERYYQSYVAGPATPKDQYGLPLSADYQVGADDGLEMILGQRQEVLDAKIGLVGDELYQRQQLRENNLYRINQDQCAIRSMIIKMGEHVWDKSRMQLEVRIWDLEEEKRKAHESYFRDILFLKKELRESLVETMEERQKATLFI